MKKLVFFAILFLSCQCVFAQKSNLSKNEIDEYSEQIRLMVRYLEETFSFIGDPENTAQEKDIIFKESYTKIFKDSEVQIEDDLDDNRSTYINKDVQAYLKDIDFFFKDIKFNFKIDDIKPQTNEKGETFFKVTMMRTIAGHNILGDTVHNSCKRFMEINIDPSKKDLKIASIYTTKPNETEELRTWWNRMPSAWKMFFGDDQFILDSIEIMNIIHIYRDSIVIVNDSLVESTIACDMPVLYEKLTSFTKITDVDVSNNTLIHSLDPLFELSELQNLDCSNTDVFDISPIRNLNKINKLDISNTAITNISDLRYTNDIKVLKANNLKIKDIEIIGLYHKLTNLSLAGTDVENIKALENCEMLTDLDISGTKVTSLDSIVLPETLHCLDLSNTNISDLKPIENLENLQLLIIDNTPVTDLTPVAKLNRLNELKCRNTNVSDIMPLKDMQHLVRIYCDNTLIDSEKADNFKNENHNVMVIYETQALQEWWDNLHVSWKTKFAKQNNIEVNPSPEELHAIISMKTLALDAFFMDAMPIERLTNLENLNLENTKIVDLTPLHGLHNLKYLNLKNTKVTDLTSIENLSNLLEINIENTPISNLEPLCKMKNLTLVKAENSKVTPEQVFVLKTAVPNVTVIYRTVELRNWWNTLDENWRNVFRDIVDMNTNPTAEQLQAVANIEEINIDTKIMISSLEPLTKLMFVKKLSIKDNHITDLSPLSEMRLLSELCIDGNAINDITPLATVKSLEVLSIENTRVVDINAVEGLENLRVLDIANTIIKNIKPLANCAKLEELNIANTNVRTLAPVANHSSLRYVKAISSKVKTKEIDALRSKRPELNIIYH